MGDEPIMSPQIPCRFDPSNPPKGEFREGMVIALLVIVQETDADNHVEADGWSVVTDDGSVAVAVSQLLKVRSTNADVIASGIPD
jgi:hypothetical protein